ncbi:MAG: Clp protease N-terminal domain-containing protein [Dehalococcoidia bacterium]
MTNRTERATLTAMRRHWTDNLTREAESAIGHARAHARRFNHTHMSTEHILLGVLDKPSGNGYRILMRMGVDIEDLRSTVEGLIAPGEHANSESKSTGMGPSAKKVMGIADMEAGGGRIGTEHLLLGLMRVEDGIAYGVLRNFEVGHEEVCMWIGYLGGDER